MSDPLSMLAIAALAVAAISVVLARVIPDRYDEPELARTRVRR